MAGKPDLTSGRVEMAHGGGGRAMARLIDELFRAELANEWLAGGDDAARFEPPGGPLVMATDSHVVSPLFFPGGDIGSLAVHGTVNDVAMGGARPLYLSAGFVLEEGFPLADLRRIVASMAAASSAAGVPVISGDTKVVEGGRADGVYINTTGVGAVHPGVAVGPARVRPGDRILVSGSLGDHGLAILSCREDVGFGTELRSDSAPLHGLVAAMAAAAPDLHCLRDPTRGGLAAALNEIADASGNGMVVRERDLPVREEVRAACEILGLDPLSSASEGRLVAFTPPEAADDLLAAMHEHPLGREAAAIGEVVADERGLVRMETTFGGSRLVEWLYGEQLPRIC